MFPETFKHKEVTGRFGRINLDHGYNKFGEAVIFNPQKGGWIKYENRGRGWVFERKIEIRRRMNARPGASWLCSLDCYAHGHGSLKHINLSSYQKGSFKILGESNMEWFRSKSNLVDNDNLYAPCPSCEGKAGCWEDCSFCEGTGVMTHEDVRRWLLIFVVAESLARVEADRQIKSRTADNYEHVFLLNHGIIADYLLKLPEEVKSAVLENV